MQEYISHLTRSDPTHHQLWKEIARKYQTAKGHLYDCSNSIETLVADEYHEVPYWDPDNRGTQWGVDKVMLYGKRNGGRQ